MKTYYDPRLKVIAEPSTNPITIKDTLFKSGSTTGQRVVVQYKLPYFGRPIGGTVSLSDWNLNPSNNILNGIANNRYSKPSRLLFMAQDMKFYIATYAELNFMLAEAKLKEHIIYARVLHNIPLLEDKYRVMDLSNPMMDDKDKMFIDKFVENTPLNFFPDTFVEMCNEDQIGNLIRNTDYWVRDIFKDLLENQQ